MTFTIVGLNHKTAPLALREQAAFNAEQRPLFLHTLLAADEVHEALLLSTCNRTEIFCETEYPDAILNRLAQHHGLSLTHLKLHSYIYQGHESLRHAIRLACGLDSMMIGEPQILGQLKDAYQVASHMGTIQNNLKQVFEFIFKKAKSIRVRSGIGNNPVSISYAAVTLINQWRCKTNQKKILLIGTGETAALVAKYLHQQGTNQFYVASRTPAHAQMLAQKVNGSALAITDIPHHLSQVDIVISATSCPIPFINSDMVHQAMQRRVGQPMFFLDLAVPRDIEPEVGLIDNVTLYNIDDLHARTQQGLEERTTAAKLAEHLVEKALHDFTRWQRTQNAGKTITAYRSHMTTLANTELQYAISKIKNGGNPIDILQTYHHRLLNKLIHSPSEGLRETAQDGRDDLLELIHYLYSIPEALRHHEEIN